MKRILLMLAVVSGGLLAFLWLWPLNLARVNQIAAASRPATSYEEALVRVANLPADGHEGDTAVLNAACPTQLRTHGQPTERVIVFLHGYTTCPAQWNLLADELFAAYNREGAAMTRRENVHRMADANKAFAHFAW